VGVHPIDTLSLFSGGGGLDLGVELAFGRIFEHVAYVECEAYAVGVLAAAMENGCLAEAPVWSDVRTVCGPQFRHYVRQATGGGGIGAFIAGYPCPDFSCAGGRAGIRGARGSLWWSLAEAIAEYEPELLFLENVGGHTSSGFDTVCSCLRAMDYRIAGGLFTASEVGAPHKRQRLFVLAQRLDEGPRDRRSGGPGAVRDGGDGDNGTTIAEPGDDMADPPRSGERGRIGQTGRDGGTGGPGDGMADARGERGTTARRTRPNRRQRGRILTGPASPELRRTRLPDFPPGPGDIDAWQKVLEIDGTVEPAFPPDAFGMLVHARRLYRLVAPGRNRRERGAASRAAFERQIRRVADGLAGRTQRLRLLGNGVVPLEAAYAFATLGACLWG